MIKREFAAESAADFHWRYPHLRDRYIQRRSHGATHLERALRARPDVQPAVIVPKGGHVLRFDVALVDRGGVELAFNNDVGLAETRGDVSKAVLKMLRHIAGCVEAPSQLLSS